MTGMNSRGLGHKLLHMREQWRTEASFAVAPPIASSFGRKRKRWRDIDLIIDLADEPMSLRWLRGMLTLSLLIAAVAFIAPNPFEPLPAFAEADIGSMEAEQYRQMAIAPLDAGSGTGGRMAANALVESLAYAPDRPTIELFVRFGGGDSLAALVARAAAREARLRQHVLVGVYADHIGAHGRERASRDAGPAADIRGARDASFREQRRQPGEEGCRIPGTVRRVGHCDPREALARIGRHPASLGARRGNAAADLDACWAMTPCPARRRGLCPGLLGQCSDALRFAAGL